MNERTLYLWIAVGTLACLLSLFSCIRAFAHDQWADGGASEAASFRIWQGRV